MACWRSFAILPGYPGEGNHKKRRLCVLLRKQVAFFILCIHLGPQIYGVLNSLFVLGGRCIGYKANEQTKFVFAVLNR